MRWILGDMAQFEPVLVAFAAAMVAAAIYLFPRKPR